MEVQIILTAIFVSTSSAIGVRSNNPMGTKINGRGNIHENFRNLFDSIRMDDRNKAISYRNILQQEAGREQKAFDLMKRKLWLPQQSKAYSKQANFRNRNGNIADKVAVSKREASVTSLFGAVTPLTGLEDFYSQPRYVYPDDLSPRMKMDICTHVSKSPIFHHTFNLSPLNPADSGVFNILKDNYPEIYADLYEERNSSHVFTNPYRRRELTAGDFVIHDFVFSCAAFDRESGNITKYYVSKVTLFNTDYCRHHPDQMKGVFIFMEKEEKTVVVAMAEQPGYVIDPSDSIYDFRVEMNLTSAWDATETKKTICGLAMHDKIRVCTLVLNAANFHERVTFVPLQENVEDECFRGVLHIEKVVANETENDNEKLAKVATVTNATEDDWMIGCKVTMAESEKSATYYISAGFLSYEQIMFCVEPDSGNMTMIGGVGCRVDVRKKVKYPLKEDVEYRKDAKHP